MATEVVQYQEHDRKGRPLGPYECVSANLSRRYSNGIFWHAAIFDAAQPIGDDDVVNACKILARKQEVLQMRIVPDDDRDYSYDFRFEPMKNLEAIDFLQVTINTKTEWATLASDDHEERKFDVVKGPLWRIILARVKQTEDNELLYEYVILFKFIHTIVDGLSVFDFVNRQFFPVLSALINGEDAEEVIPYSKQISPVEELFPESQKLFNFFMKLQLYYLRLKNRMFKQSPLPAYKFSDEKTPEESELTNDTHIVPIKFGKRLCDAVMVAAKSHGITVHTVLLCAGVLALSHVANVAGVKLPFFIRQAWPVSRRKEVGLKTPGPLCYIGTDATTLHKTLTYLTTAEFWIECGKVKEQVEKEKGVENSILFWRGGRYVHDEAMKNNGDVLKVLSELGQPPHLFLSNLGKMNSDSDYIGKDGDINMRVWEQYFCLTGLAVTDFCPLAQFLLHFQGKFMYTICFSPQKVSRKFVDTYIEHLKDVLVQYCMTDTTIE